MRSVERGGKRGGGEGGEGRRGGGERRGGRGERRRGEGREERCYTYTITISPPSPGWMMLPSRGSSGFMVVEDEGDEGGARVISGEESESEVHLPCVLCALVHA